MFSSSTNSKLCLELNKIDFVFSSPKCILGLLFANQSEILVKSYVNSFFCFSDIPVTFQGTIINHLHISASAFYSLAHIIDINQKRRRLKIKPYVTPHEICANFEIRFAASTVK